MKKTWSIILAMLMSICLIVSAFAEAPAETETAAPETAETPAETAAAEEPVLLASVNGQEIWSNNADMQEMIDYYVSYYSSYGYDVSDDPSLKAAGLRWAMEGILYEQKAAELGVPEMTEEQKAEQEEKARATWNEVLEYYMQAVGGLSDEATDAEKETARQNALAYIQTNFGYTEESFIAESLEEAKTTQLRENVQRAVLGEFAVTDEEVTAYFNELVEEDKQTYEGNVPAYEYYTQYMGSESYYVPEGYRGITHILLKVDDELMSNYTSLAARLEEQQQAEQAAAETAAPETGDAAETAAPETGDAAETAAPEAAAAEPTEEPKEPVTQEMVDAARQAIFDSVQDQVNDIRSRYESGTPFAQLIAEYGTDPGMLSEQAKQDYAAGTSFADLYAKYGLEMLGENAEKGYSVHAESLLYEQIFTDTAKTLEKVGDVSEPILGRKGVHILCYTRDVPAGAVEMTEEMKEKLRQELLSEKESEAVSAMTEDWMKTAEIVYTDEGQAIIDAAEAQTAETVETTEATEEALTEGAGE